MRLETKSSILIVLSIAFIVSINWQNKKGLEWTDNFDMAIRQSSKMKKPILMRFQGSDWCGNCWRLDSTLFETKAFEEYAPREFILLALDYPSKPENQLPEEQAQHNKKWQEKYNPNREFPAVLVLDKNGELLGQMNVAPNSADGFIGLLKEIVVNSSK